MGKIIEFRNMNFAFNKENAFKDFNMEIEEQEIVTLIGTPASGKTTLLKMLVNQLPNDYVYYKGMNIKNCNVEELKNNIVVIFDTPILSSTVKAELTKYISKLGIDEDTITERLNSLDKAFGLKRLYDVSTKELSLEESYLIKILRFLIINPKFLAIDSMVSYLSKNSQKKLFAYIKKNKIALLNVTTDLNQALYGDKICVLDNFTLILEGNTLSVLKTDTLLKRLGFSLPLAVDLSIELNHYDVISKIYTEKEKLVNALWKK